MQVLPRLVRSLLCVNSSAPLGHACFSSERTGLAAVVSSHIRCAFSTRSAASAAMTGDQSMNGEPSYDYDLITLGAGSGGVRASRFAAQFYDAKVAVVELPFGFVSSETVGGAGGTCVIRGCVPKKLLVYAAQFRDEFEDAVGFGWAKAVPPHDWRALIGSKTKEISRLNQVYMSLLKNAGVHYEEGRGALKDAHTVEVTAVDGQKRTLTAKHILVATGGYAVKIPIEGAEHAITSDEALSLESLPEKNKSVVIVGSGYIAVEFAGIFSGLGLDVHLMFRAEKPLKGFDEECREQIKENMSKRGINLHAGQTPTKVEKLDGDEGYRVTYKTPDGPEKTMDVGLVMMATGRKPKSKDIGLEAAGIELNEKGAIKVDEYSRTSVPHIFAIGDVTARIELTPVALMEGMAFAHTVFGNKPTKPDYQFVASAVFCQPPMAYVGFTEEAAQEALSGPIDVYVSKFRPMKLTISGREERTLMKLLVHVDSDRVIGCHVVGPDAPDIMQGVAIAIKCGATKKVFDGTIGIHPTAAEELVTMRTKTRTVQGRGSAKL